MNGQHIEAQFSLNGHPLTDWVDVKFFVNLPKSEVSLGKWGGQFEISGHFGVFTEECDIFFRDGSAAKALITSTTAWPGKRTIVEFVGNRKPPALIAELAEVQT